MIKEIDIACVKVRDVETVYRIGSKTFLRKKTKKDLTLESTPMVD